MIRRVLEMGGGLGGRELGEESLGCQGEDVWTLEMYRVVDRLRDGYITSILCEVVNIN